MRLTLVEKIMVVVYGLSFLAAVALWGTIAYAALHFIIKFW